MNLRDRSPFHLPYPPVLCSIRVFIDFSPDKTSSLSIRCNFKFSRSIVNLLRRYRIRHVFLEINLFAMNEEYSNYIGIKYGKIRNIQCIIDVNLLCVIGNVYCANKVSYINNIFDYY